MSANCGARVSLLTHTGALIRRQAETRLAHALKSARQIDTLRSHRTAAIVSLAFVHIDAQIQLVWPISAMALALERADHIDALVLAHRRHHTGIAFVHIDAAAIVAAIDHEATQAAALHATVHNVALLLAAAILVGTQIGQLALRPICCNR